MGEGEGVPGLNDHGKSWLTGLFSWFLMVDHVSATARCLCMLIGHIRGVLQYLLRERDS